MKSIWIGWGILISLLMLAGPAVADGQSNRPYRGERRERIQPYGERRAVPFRPGYRRDGDRRHHDGRRWKRRQQGQSVTPDRYPASRRNPRGGIDPPRPIDPPRRIENRRQLDRRAPEPSRPLRFYKRGRSGGADR